MEKNRLQPLTEIEKRQAEEHHGLVYSFLHRHGYLIEEFYNIVIFGYLKAIQTYNRREDLRKNYQLAFICERHMRAEIKDHFRVQNAQKRKPMETILSLDAEYSGLEDTSTINLYNLVGGKSVEDELKESELLEELLENLSEVQRNIVMLKMEGLSNKEVYDVFLTIPSSTYYKELDRIKVIFKGLVG